MFLIFYMPKQIYAFREKKKSKKKKNNFLPTHIFLFGQSTEQQNLHLRDYVYDHLSEKSKEKRKSVLTINEPELKCTVMIGWFGGTFETVSMIIEVKSKTCFNYKWTSSNAGWWMDGLGALHPFQQYFYRIRRMEMQTWRAPCNEAPFRFGKNLTSSRIWTRDPIISSPEG